MSENNSYRERMYDAIVVGGAIAGSTVAVLLRLRGLSVALIESRALDSYKALCTHFIQPSAVPVLLKIGLGRVLEPDISTRTKATFVTSEGVIDTDGGYTDDPTTAYAYNIERRVLDPELRRRALDVGVDMFTKTVATACQIDDDGSWRVEVETSGHCLVLHARTVIAADGRRSRMAKWLKNPAVEHENQRAAVFAQFDYIDPPRNNRSLFILSGNEMGFVYPLPGGRTLLSAYVEKHKAASWHHQSDIAAELLDFFIKIPSGLVLENAKLLTPVLGYLDYPSQFRHPVCGSIAFVGDAVQSVDPMSGAGCGFAMEAAVLLDESLGLALQTGQQSTIKPALDIYQRRFVERFSPHARGIVADSLIAKQTATRAALYRTVISDSVLQREYLALTGRLTTPEAFQRTLLSYYVRLRKIPTKVAQDQSKKID